jgi:hypothetical protein
MSVRDTSLAATAVDQDVDPAVLVEDRLDGTGPIFLAADVEAHASHPIGMRAVRRGDIAGIRDRAFASEELDYLIAHAAGSTRT